MTGEGWSGYRDVDQVRMERMLGDDRGTLNLLFHGETRFQGLENATGPAMVDIGKAQRKKMDNLCCGHQVEPNRRDMQSPIL
mmetsp:Transcript_3612/g.6858  ORF Transcript_3612/g.6858 Transcript_3612/m.6858 type:complete len:82 (+) Transcript_3612:355-600(+)